VRNVGTGGRRLSWWLVHGFDPLQAMICIGTKQAGVWSMKRYWERVHGLNGLMVMLVVTMLVIGWVVLLDLTVDHSFLQGVLSCVKDREAKNKDASDMVCWILHWRARRSMGC